MYSIRFATIEDLPALRSLWSRMETEVAPHYPRDLGSPRALDAFTRQAAMVLTDPEPMTFILVVSLPDGTVSGFHVFGYQVRQLGEPREIVFSFWLYLAPELRGSGAHDDLCYLSTEHAINRGIEMAEITRAPDWPDRWGKLGFEPYEIRSCCPTTLLLARLDERRRARQAAQGNGVDRTAAAEEGVK